MKIVYQTVFKTGLGDCFRACVCSLFELHIDEMPNFWEQTQDAHKYWELVNEWSVARLQHKLISISVQTGHDYYVKDLLCIATGYTERSDEQHCVVWRNRIIHDPFPGGAELPFTPEVYTLLVPCWDVLDDSASA